MTNYQFDAQVSRIFPIHESFNLTLRLEAFNVLNHPNFNIPTGGTTGTPGAPTGGMAVLTSGTFGQVSTTANQPRIFQGSVKFNFRRFPRPPPTRVGEVTTQKHCEHRGRPLPSFRRSASDILQAILFSHAAGK